MQSWRDAGGEPDIALALPSWLRELGFEIRGLRPLVEIAATSSFVWQWPRAFVDVGLKRLVELGLLGAGRAREIWQSFLDRESRPETLVMTPVVLEIIAARGR